MITGLTKPTAGEIFIDGKNAYENVFETKVNAFVRCREFLRSRRLCFPRACASGRDWLYAGQGSALRIKAAPAPAEVMLFFS